MIDENSGHSPLVDQDARREAVNNLKENLWVEAGAGTGKTTLLVDRLLHIITSGAARLDEIAAITFTEKAASELRARLREKLEETLLQVEPEQAKYVQQALDDIESASISTIHAFAAGLLRERPVEAGLDPRFSVAEKEEIEDLLTRTWEQWLSAELIREAPPLRKAMNRGIKIEQLISLGKLLYHNRDLVWEGKMPQPVKVGTDHFIRQIEAFQPELKELLKDCTDDTDQGYLALQAYLRQFEELLSLPDREEQERYLIMHLEKISARGNKNNWLPKTSCDRQKEICRDLNTELEKLREAIAAGMVFDLSEWCSEGYLAAVEHAKQDQALLDFQDLLLKARNLIRDSLSIRGYFQERFRYLLIDEFQDTDPLQVDLVFMLAEEKPLAENWHGAILTPGKLFLVGDPKQSIYRFRRADIEIYQSAKEKILAEGKFLNITQNFRTVAPLIEWVNFIFNNIIKPRENYQPAYQHLSAFRNYSDQASLIVIEPEDELAESSADQIRTEEANAAAAFIKGAVNNLLVNRNEEEERILHYADIALLFPAMTGLEHYEEALRRQGIPYRLEGGKNYYQRQEIVALKNLLNSLANPYDRTALVSVLRYWGGISDQQLFEYKMAGGHFNYLLEPLDNFPSICRTMSWLCDSYWKQYQYSLSAFVEKLLQESWYWQRALLDRRSAQVTANLRKIIQLIRSREQEQPLTLKNFSSWLEKVWSGQQEEEESMLHDSGGDEVQLLTIHKAKGLEFPVVLMLNSAVSGGGKGSEFISDRLENQFYLRLNKDLRAAGYDQALEKEKLRLEAERLRLFYVAATRARDYFVLPRFHNKKSPGYWAYLEVDGDMNDSGWPGLKVLARDSLYQQEPAVESDTHQEETPDPDQLLVRRWQLVEDLNYAYCQASKPAPYYGAGEFLEPYIEPDEKKVSLDGEMQSAVIQNSGASFGSAFHQVMEQYDPASDDPEKLQKVINEASRYWALSSQDELAKTVEKTLKHPLLARIRNANQYWREVPFVYNMAGYIIEGIIDLLFVEENSLVVVDYKTDFVSGEALEKRWQRYQRQGQIYGLAMHDITGMGVKEIVFYFVRANSIRTIERPELDQIKINLMEIIEKNRDPAS